MLKTKYLHLPIVAMLGQLADIKPVSGSQWTNSAKLYLLSIVDEKPLIGMVSEISKVINTVM